MLISQWWHSNSPGSATLKSAMRGTVAKQLLALFSEEASGNGDAVTTFFEYEFARDEACSPLVFIGAALAAIGSNVFLRNTVDNGADPGPHAGTGAHGTGLVC